MPPYLQKRGSLYYARLRIPEELVPHYKKKQLIKSLKTHELHEAKPRALNAVAEWQTEFEVLRGKLTPLNEKALQIRTIAAGLDTTVDPDTGESERSLYLDFEFEKLRDRYEFGDATNEQILEEFTNITHRRKTPFNLYVDRFLSQWDVNDKSKDLGKTFLTLLGTHFETLESITRPRVFEFIDKSPTSNATKMKNFSFARQYWEFLENRGIVDPDKRNPFSELKLSTKKSRSSKTPRTPFTKAEIETLHKEAVRSGDQDLADLIAIGAYTGARINEICSLKCTDVENERGVYKLCIRQAKTDAGVREIPVHPKLKPVIKRLMTNSEDGYLMPSSGNNKYNNRSGRYIKRFGRMKKELGFSSGHVFHSIRMTVATLFEHMESSREFEGVVADILGHEKAGFTFKVYSGRTSWKQRVEAINKLSYKLQLN